MTVRVILLPTLTLSLRVALAGRRSGVAAAELAPSLRLGERATVSLSLLGGLPYEAGVGLPSSSPAMVASQLLDVSADTVRENQSVGLRILATAD